MEKKNNCKPLFESIEDDFWLVIQNSTGSDFNITLFDAANQATNGYMTTYIWTIPTADFPFGVATTIVKNGTTTGITAPTTPTDLLNSLNALGTFYHYTSGANEIYYTSSATTTWGNIVALNTYTPSTQNSLAGSIITLTTPNWTYGQLVNGLVGNPFYVDNVSVYANTTAQLIKQFTTNKYDYFGGLTLDTIKPILSMWVNQPGQENIPFKMWLDGNNTIGYTAAANSTVALRFSSKASDIQGALGCVKREKDYNLLLNESHNNPKCFGSKAQFLVQNKIIEI